MSVTLIRTDIEPRVHALGQVAHLWLDPAHPVRREAIIALQVSTGFTRTMIEQALCAAFEELTEEKIRDFYAQEVATTVNRPPKVLHILAGNVFTAWLPGAVATLLVGSECHLKPSTREPVFPPLWKRSVEAIDAGLAGRIHIVPWRDDLIQDYPAVVAYGSDDALQSLKRKASSGTNFIGFGHKFSVAVIWKEALSPLNLPDLLDQLETAVSPFDLEGCLSPQILYLEGEDPGIFEPLYARVRVMPRMKRFESWNDLKTELEDYRPHLSALGYAGSPDRTRAIQADLDALGFSRVCPVGEMQRPPLSWRNGGVSWLEALTRG